MKLHPLSIPYRTANLALQWAWILIVAAFAIPNVLDGAAAVAGIGSVVIAFLGGAIAWQVAYYRRYEYDLTEDTLDIEAGVLSRRTREIPYGRIQNVSIDRNVVQRALGLAEVRVDTAGGSGSEAHLQFVGHDDARWLQDEVSERKRRERDAERAEAVEGAEGAETGERDAAADEPGRASAHREVLFEISPHELSVLGLVSLFDPRALPVLFFLLVPFQGTVQDWVLQDGLTVVGLGLLVLVVLGVYAAVAGVRAIYEVANYYGFQLVRSDDELRYERGLLQKFSGTIPLAKVQALTLGEHVVARAVGYATLGLETAGFSPGETAGSRAAIPIARLERVLEVAGRVEPVELPEFERPPRRARERYVVRYALVVAALAALGYGLDSVVGVWIGPWYWPLGLLLAVPLAAHLKWKHLGYALTEDHVVTRHGFWNRTTKVVPYHRVQTVADSQTIFQRRRDLATLHVDIAGSRSLVGDDSKAVDVEAGTADELRETISERMHESLEEGRRRSGRRFVDVGAAAGEAPPGPSPGDADVAGQD